jgi:hypothetical protein
MADLQWFVCAQGYDFALQNKYIVKELCVMCVQTQEYFTWHILPALWAEVDIDLDSDEIKTIINYHVLKHNLTWHAGTADLEQVKTYVRHLIHTCAEVYTTNGKVRDLFKSWGYSDVSNLKLPPINHFNNAPTTTCGCYDHGDGFPHCAQRQCFEYVVFLRPALVPYLVEDMLVYKPLVANPTIPEKDDLTIKFGELSLQEPQFQKLSKVRLPHYYNGATHCQFCVAGSDGCVCQSSKAGKQVGGDPQGGEGEASNQPARATNN